jgi:hypothetical protein
MPTLILDPLPAEVEQLLKRRRERGAELLRRPHVDELLVVDPAARTVDWRALTENGYELVERSRLIDLSAAELAARLDWPA